MANPAATPRRPALLPLFVLLCISLLSSSLAQQQQPAFLFDWFGGKSAFSAGDTAVITVRVLDFPDAASRRSSLSFRVSVNGKKGNSTYLTDVAAHLGDDPSSWTITFVPLRAGDFVATVAEERFSIGESTLQFTVAAAGVHPSASRVSWTFDDAYVVAGSVVFLSVSPRDAFGNGIARGDDMPDCFKVSGSYFNGSAVEFLDFHYNGWIEDGRIGLEFKPTVAGDFMVHVYGDNRELRDSPLVLTVNPGILNIEKSICSWKHGINTFQIFSKLEIFIYPMDSFGNIVSQIDPPFDAQVVDTTSNLSIPVVGLMIEAVADGVQHLSFSLVRTGEFVLTIFDAQLKQRVSNKVYMFDVFVGYCNGSNSFANGSGLANSVAGSTSSFAVFLRDQYNNPSPVETTKLHVKILAKNGMSYADPIVSPGRQEIVAGNTIAQGSQFNVSYTSQIAGKYEIWVLCGNIVLNAGSPYAMTVLPGAINMSLSGVVKFHPRVKMSVENEVDVRLVDSFMNPLVSSESKLIFPFRRKSPLRFSPKPGSIATSAQTPTIAAKFFNNRDGSYTIRYVVIYLGSYDICVKFEDKKLSPCPFEVNVLPDEYFSDVKNDSVSVWENESVSFDVLSNDYIAGSKAKAESFSPLHGSVLQFNHTCRYTPFEGFFGNDSFSYTISDEYNNVVTATVFISVLCRPPRFISLPQKLHVIEDTIGPQFGGFPGIKIANSDTKENISVTVKAQSGNVFLAPTPTKLQNSSDDVLSIGRGGKAGEDLILEGTVEAINGALQFLQYVGKKDFYGNDVIELHTMAKSGVEDAQVPIFVEPINDHPVILAPRSIFLGGKESREGHQIFDKSRDKFKFSIFEPDLHNFPENKSHFSLVLSLEVFEGTLTLSLPASTIPTVELKIEGVNHWQPLQTYVIIDNHFVLRGTAIRFRGLVQDCNYAMQQLHYQGPSNETTLSITVNDLGNYGCYPDCSKMMGMPLSAAKTVRLKTKHKIMGTPPFDAKIVLNTKLVGLVMVIEILTMLCLGVVLLYFLFKCIKALKVKRRSLVNYERRTPVQTPSHWHVRVSSPSQSEDVGHCLAPAAAVPSGANRSSFRRRCSRSRKQELELQPVPGFRNNGNQDGVLVTGKDE